MIGHLGNRVSALLDGQLSELDEDRAWEHVHLCPICREQVEREGWVKTQLAGLTFAPDPYRVPDELRTALLDAAATGELDRQPSGDQLVMMAHRPRRHAHPLLVGGSALGAAMLGVLALAAAPAQAPSTDRRLPTTSLVRHLDPQPAPRLPAPSEATRAPVMSTIGVRIEQ